MFQYYLLILLLLSNDFFKTAPLANGALLNESETIRIQNAISTIPKDLIPDKFMHSKDENGNWCCRVSNPIVNIHQTRVVSYSFVNSGNHRCGYQSCGFLGWGTCTKWCFSYWTEIRYMIENFDVTYQQPCPQEHVICCSDHFLIMDHCFHISEIQNNLELLSILNNQGIVFPIG
ncbi:unnamed protein product [Brachionus calyciflorus]|uniref:Uncharacterized protein n=1 Tax=Brachionus calyciflorus TaxID=104777 RepID=A0A814CAC0_9BILA|nr:unnamed protein product [Brachionus calyciflorus]